MWIVFKRFIKEKFVGYYVWCLKLLNYKFSIELNKKCLYFLKWNEYYIYV